MDDDRPYVTRRRFLVAGGALVAGAAGAAMLVDRRVLPGHVALDHALGRCSVDGDWPRDAPAAQRQDGTIASQARRRDVPYTVVRLAGVTGELPVVLVLHGRGSRHDAYVRDLHLDAFLGAHVAAGGRPFALACAAGGDRYWHPRADGDDPLRMLTDELLPRLRALGLTTDPMGVLGWSMGGYGALLWVRLAGQGALPDGVRVTAAVAESPALFRSFADATPGAFDSAADFAQWGDLIERPGSGTRAQAWVDCGTSDPFADVTRAYAARNPRSVAHFTDGCHDHAYWRSRAAVQVSFLGERLR